MFIDAIQRRNPKLIDACFNLHKNEVITADTYVIDIDTLIHNAKKILDQANKQNIELYFMLKQVGRNPYIAKKLIEIGYKGAVVVDFKEGIVMKKHNIPICNIGHLVQVPKSLIKEFIEYGCEYFTVYSIDKIKEINEVCKNLNKVQKIILKVVEPNDLIYSGQTSGFKLEELSDIIDEIITLENIKISGVTSFPCFVYNESNQKNTATNNFFTIIKAQKILQSKGIIIDNLNAPSTTSVKTLKEMIGFNVSSGEPGHGLTGTTPMHVNENCEEIPCVMYVTEISHNFDNKSYCYGGGHYRRSHVKKAIVGNYNCRKMYIVTPPSDESIDYYFELDKEAHVSDTVLMSFRFQIFVTRSTVALVEGISKGEPKVVGIYNSLGDLYE